MSLAQRAVRGEEEPVPLPTKMCLFQGEDDGQRLINLAQYIAVRDADKPVGVYAIYDDASTLQYVGYSRNVIAALKVSPGPRTSRASKKAS